MSLLRCALLECTEIAESASQERHALRVARNELVEIRERFETFRRDVESNAATQKAEFDAAFAETIEALRGSERKL